MPASPVIILPNASSSAPVSAKITTALTGANNDAVWTWLYPGTTGNGKTLEYIISGSYPAVGVSLVSTTGVLVTGPVGTTLNQVRAAVAITPAVAAKVQCDIASGNDGTGAVITLTSTAFAGGTGSPPLSPAAILP